MILIVDDIPANIFSLQRILESQGFTVDSALSGEEALKKILTNTYVLIILDVQMPGMDGFEVAAHISGLERTRNTAIIFLSANSTDVKLIAKGYQHGASDYITKPVDAEVLVLKVKTMYSLYEAKLKNDVQQKEIANLYNRERQLNDTLSRYTDRLMEAQRLAQMGNWVYLFDTREIQCEPEIYTMLGISNQTRIDLPFILKHMPPEERHLISGFWRAFGDQDTFEFNHQYLSEGQPVKHLKEYGKIEKRGGIPYKMIGIVQDITGEKEKEAEIMKAYERYELVNKATNDLLWDWDILNNSVECNANIQTMYGYQADDVGRSVEWWQNIIHPRDTQHLFTVFVETAHAKKKSCSCEYRMKCADGSYKEVYNQAYCLYNEDGRLLRIISAVKDVSELKRTEKELLDTEFKLLQTVESINEGFFTCNNSWEITYWNKLAAQVLGVSKEDAIGKNLWDVFPEAKSTRFYEYYMKCISTKKPYSFEEYYAPKDRWYRVNVHPSGDGIAVYFEDITDELMNELKLNNARIQAEVTNNVTRDIIWEWDLKTNRVKVNKNFSLLFGYDRKKTEMSFDWWKNKIHPDEMEKVKDSILSAINDGYDSWEKEYRFSDAKGAYHIVSARAIFLRNDKSEPYKVTGSMSDIQALREVESKLHEIAFSNSHVIRRPLANILGLIHLLDDKIIADDDLSKLIRLIKKSSMELDDVIKQIASVARV